MSIDDNGALKVPKDNNMNMRKNFWLFCFIKHKVLKVFIKNAAGTVVLGVIKHVIYLGVSWKQHVIDATV